MIGIIGFGRFGRLMTGYLSSDFDVTVYNRGGAAEQIARTGAKPGSLDQVCHQKAVLLSVPISSLQSVLRQIAPLLGPDTLVMDVCSVKVYPVNWMMETLPSSVALLGTHPMFGPDSAADSLKDRKIVLCKVRIEEPRFEAIKEYLTGKGLKVIETTPDEHDRQIAVSLALTHFIGRSLDEFGAGELMIDTEGYKRLLHILEVVTHDTWQLFRDMNRYNPYAGEKRRAFTEAVIRLEEKLEAGV